MKLGIYYNIFRSQVRCLSKNPKNHYDSLGITPKCTQGEIKTAYYKLSKVYHPDKNSGNSDSAQKFRDITEAYEVLGNVRSRKLYDRGLYVRHAFPSNDDKMYQFRKSRDIRSRPPPPTGRTPIYDFDEWSKVHYGATFKKQQENRQKAQNYTIKRQQDALETKAERVIFGVLIVMFLSMFILRAVDYDKVEVEKSK